MKTRVKFFASAADAAECREREQSLPDGATVSDLLNSLCEDCPALGKIRPALRVAVNLEYVQLDHPLSDNDEVALIPPVSGGRG